MRDGVVRHDGSYRFFVHDVPGLEWRNDVLGGPLDVVGPASLTSLKNAVHRLMLALDGRIDDEPVELKLTDVPGQYFDHDVAPWGSISLELINDRWSIQVETWEETESQDDPVDHVALARLMKPLMSRRNATFHGCATEFYEGGARRIVLSAGWSSRGKTVDDAVAFGREMEALFGASKGGLLDMGAARDLITSGNAHLLRGQPEGQWLDAKGAPYDLAGESREREAWELAKDVAAFANSITGGMILIGATTRDPGDGEVINGFREFELSTVKRQAYRNYVAQKVFPRVAGFEVIWVEGNSPGRGLALLVIPPQAPASRPFLVRGVVRGRKELGAHVLWPERREDDTAKVPIERLHALIRLGQRQLDQSGRVDT